MTVAAAEAVAIGASTITMLAMDAFWLSLRAKYHYDLMKSVQGSAPEIRVVPALLVYVLMPLAVWFFAIRTSKSLKEAVLAGALLGLSMYGVYDLTNLASLKAWTIEMSITDTLWGTTICAVAAAAGFYAKTRFTAK